MTRRGLFSLLAALAATIGIGKVPTTTRRRSPAKSPISQDGFNWVGIKDLTDAYNWKQLHAPVTLAPSDTAFAEQNELIRKIEQKLLEAARKEMEDGTKGIVW